MRGSMTDVRLQQLSKRFGQTVAVDAIALSIAAGQPLGFTIPMLIATTGAAVAFVVTLLFSPETRGTELVPELTLVEPSVVEAPA